MFFLSLEKATINRIFLDQEIRSTITKMLGINNSLLGLEPPQSLQISLISAMGCVYLSISSLEMRSDLKKDLRVYRIGSMSIKILDDKF